MEEITNAKLISLIEEDIRIFDRPRKTYMNELLRRFKEINCLEAKPKALHSMKCDGNENGEHDFHAEGFDKYGIATYEVCYDCDAKRECE
ncbi:MAG: hypothetical protein VYB44_07300 [Bacteroidota bacterium]|nr:hypothetical protein [Bacteroidota bacterium]